ncbi:type II toxin-antitoxin system PemK/MazF family toxin [Salinarimonas sp. NSM]|uniref:type II toxin-antitoxin system PemK/MazF family toxin n=1 Tax=Salinarimonas sp. NSM TaxID=3458003 RepID=UPI004035F774
MSFERFDVVVVPFPFVDVAVSKRRPVVILSVAPFNAAHGHVVVAMITTAAAGTIASDVRVTDLAASGLTHPCVVRWKLFSIDKTLVGRRLGALCETDRIAVDHGLRAMLIG